MFWKGPARLLNRSLHRGTADIQKAENLQVDIVNEYKVKEERNQQIQNFLDIVP